MTATHENRCVASANLRGVHERVKDRFSVQLEDELRVKLLQHDLPKASL